MQVKYGWSVNDYSFVASKQYCTFSCCSVAIVLLTYHVTFENKEISHLPISFLVDFNFEKDDLRGEGALQLCGLEPRLYIQLLLGGNLGPTSAFCHVGTETNSSWG